MPGPDAQQLPGGGPDAIFSLCLSIVFCLDYPILPYALSFYWHFVLRPLHFILFFYRFHPPGTTRGSCKSVIDTGHNNKYPNVQK